jgi:hypothetical protein
MSKLEKSGWLPPSKRPKPASRYPLPGSHLVHVREVNQHGHQPLLLIEDQYALLFKAGRNAYGLKAETHAAAWLLFR